MERPFGNSEFSFTSNFLRIGHPIGQATSDEVGAQMQRPGLCTVNQVKTHNHHLWRAVKTIKVCFQEAKGEFIEHIFYFKIVYLDLCLKLLIQKMEGKSHWEVSKLRLRNKIMYHQEYVINLFIIISNTHAFVGCLWKSLILQPRIAQNSPCSLGHHQIHRNSLTSASCKL